jgi:hypothetical protein
MIAATAPTLVRAVDKETTAKVFSERQSNRCLSTSVTSGACSNATGSADFWSFAPDNSLELFWALSAIVWFPVFLITTFKQAPLGIVWVLLER